MNAAQRATLAAIFATPVRADIRWTAVVGLIKAAGGTVSQGRGSRVRLSLNGVVATFHAPHPEPTTDKGAVISLRRFLTEAGVKP